MKYFHTSEILRFVDEGNESGNHNKMQDYRSHLCHFGCHNCHPYFVKVSTHMHAIAVCLIVVRGQVDGRYRMFE